MAWIMLRSDQRIGKCEVRTQFGGRALWLGAGEGLAKAGEELTWASQDHPSENCPLWAFIFKQQGQQIETLKKDQMTVTMTVSGRDILENQEEEFRFGWPGHQTPPCHSWSRQARASGCVSCHGGALVSRPVFNVALFRQWKFDEVSCGWYIEVQDAYL